MNLHNFNWFTKGKMRVLLLILTFSFCSFSAYCLTSAEKDVSITTFTIHDGLSGNGITSIFQDSKGFIWVGTEDGLNRYDGYSFKIYRHNLQDSTSISGNHVRCIQEDKDGNLWIGTIGAGLNKWDRETDAFINYSSKSSKQNALPEDNIYSIAFESDSSFWVKTDNYLLKIYTSPIAREVYGLYSNIFKYQDNIKVPIFHKSNSHLWIGTKEGIAQFNTNEKLYERLIVDHRYNLFSNDLGAIADIIQLAPNKYLLGGNQGLYSLTENDSSSFTTEKVIGLSRKESSIYALLQHSSGAIWAGTKEGLRLLNYNKDNNQISYDPQNIFNKENSLISKVDITYLFEDNSGLLWVGTKYRGLLKLDFKPQKFKSIKAGDEGYYGLNTSDYRSIIIDKNKRIWLGTADKGIKIIDTKMNYVYSYAVNKSLYNSGEDIVLALCEDSKNRIWIGTNNGIYIFHLDRGTISEFSYTYNKEVKSLLKTNRINSIEEDLQGNIWFGTQFGLYCFDGTSITNYFADKNSNEGICSDEINNLFLDSEGILWIGTNDGVNFIDTKSDTLREFGHLRNSNDSISVLSNNFILSITEDDKQRIWFGTRSGLSYYSKKEDKSGFYTHSSGLANDMIYGVVCDNNGGVWLSTNKGISLIKNKDEIYNFDIADGLPGYVFNRGAVEKSESGYCYFAGVEGLAFIHPDSVHYNLHRPKVEFTTIELYHRGKLIERFKPDQKDIRLKYRKSSMLKVKYAALEFSEPHKNKFQVYLEGFDDEWQPVTLENEINISDLPDGDFVLHVKGANNDQIWSNEAAQLNIRIIPPIWMSNYAYAFYLIALIFLIQSIINYRIRHYKSAYKSLEEKAVDKKRIEAQKELLSKINQSLTDSIYYAKRIQESILPTEQKIKQTLPESFVYFRPKDLVSGDFYWMHEVDGKIFVAAVDCTGHGVPGAFMSIIAYDMLKWIINSSIEYCPAKILDKLNQEVIATFKKNVDFDQQSSTNVNDGMDIALCMIDKKEKKLSFAGAYNPLYMVRGNEIFVYKGDRFPIGFQGDKEMLFSKREIAMEENDTFYIFSDGYADQFGGTEGKKFKYRRFRHLLLNIHKLPAEDQKAILHQKIEEWMGDLEQVDDIIVMGMKPLK